MRRAVTVHAAVWPNKPSATAFVPFMLLMAILWPAWLAWGRGVFTKESALWGLVGLDTVGAAAWRPFAGDQSAPPLFAWMTSLALQLPIQNKLLLLPLPAYFYAVGVLLVIYLIGRTWFTPATGLLSCFLIALNRVFLDLVRRSDPDLGVLFWLLVSLLVYLRHLRSEEDTLSRWTFLGAAAFGALLLSAGFNGFWAAAIGLLNVLWRELDRRDSWGPAVKGTVGMSTSRAGVVVVVGGVLLASPWLAMSSWSSGPWAPWSDPGERGYKSIDVMDHVRSMVLLERRAPEDPRLSADLFDLMRAMPATLVLSLYGLWRTFRGVIGQGSETPKQWFPILWTVIALVAWILTMPTPAGELFLIVPLTLLAARALLAILRREIHDRTALLLMIGSAWVYVFTTLRLPRVQWSSDPYSKNWGDWMTIWKTLSVEDKYALHLGFDRLLVAGGLILWLYRSTRGVDRRRRWLLGGFIVGVLSLAVWNGTDHLGLSAVNDNPWRRIHDELQAYRGASAVIYLGSEPPDPALRFIVRSQFPDRPRLPVPQRDQLDRLPDECGDRFLVLVTDTRSRLPRSLSLSRGEQALTLERVLDSPLVAAYAAQPTVAAK